MQTQALEYSFNKTQPVNKNGAICFLLLFLFMAPRSHAQVALADSIIDFYWYHNISYDFRLTVHSAVWGAEVTTGSVVGYIDNKTQYRLLIDSVRNNTATEYVGTEYVKNKRAGIVGCNYYTDSSYANFDKDPETFQKRVSPYQPDHIFDMEKFKKMFSDDKKYERKIVRDGSFLSATIKEIMDTAINTTGQPKPLNNISVYRISKADYSVKSVKRYHGFAMDGYLYQDSSEMLFNYKNISREWKARNQLVQFVFAFKPNKRTVSSKQIEHSIPVKSIPDFILMDTLKGLFRSSNIQSRFTLITFWYTACQPCLDNFERLDGIRDSLDAKQLEILAINDLDVLDRDTKDFLAAFKPNYTVLFNGRYLRDGLKITTHPSTFIIDNQSRKVLFYKKGTDENSVKEILAEMRRQR